MEEFIYKSASEVNELLKQAEVLIENNDYVGANKLLKIVIEHNNTLSKRAKIDYKNSKELLSAISDYFLLNRVINKICKYIPVINGEYIFFGYYPQSLKKEDITILSTFPDNDGYYLGSDGERYAKVVALKPSIFTHGVFIDGVTPIIKGNTYYFKVEPIEWKIEHKARKTYRVISDSLLDCPEFNSSKDDRIINNKIVYANNYEHSDVRKWLNNDFLNKAFTKEAQAYINTTNVDNSYISMGKKIDINNIYACNETIDKIFLPSVKDMSNSKYGYLGSYGGDATRERYTTDYVRALGSDGSGGGTGKYMTRSPDSKSKDNIRVVAFNGDIHYVTDVNHYRNYENKFYEGFFAGVTPCMSITIK